MDGMDCCDKVGKAFRSRGMEPQGFELRQFYPEMFFPQQKSGVRLYFLASTFVVMARDEVEEIGTECLAKRLTYIVLPM